MHIFVNVIFDCAVVTSEDEMTFCYISLDTLKPLMYIYVNPDVSNCSACYTLNLKSMKLSRQFKFTHVTLDGILLYIRENINNGKLPQFSDYSDAELLELAQVSKPIIEARLDFAGDLAIQQLEQKKNNSDKATLSEVIASSDEETRIKA